jgi:tetratricopeptide (TPR) repeat protein
MFDVVLFVYSMLFLAIAYPLLLKSVVVVKPLSQVVTTGLSYVGIILLLIVIVIGGGRVNAYEQYLTGIQEGTPLSEKIYSQLSHDPYIALTYSAHQIQSVNYEISQEEKELNVRSGIEALQKIYVTYPKDFMLLSSIEQLNTMYQQVVGEYPINTDELKLLLAKSYPSNPSTRYQKALTQLQSQNIVSTEGEPQKDVVVAKESIQESMTILEALTKEYTTLQQAHLLLAYALTASGDITGAEQSYLRALVIDPINKAAVIGLAQNLITQERKEEARKLLETYQKDNEDDEEIKKLLELL